MAKEKIILEDIGITSMKMRRAMSRRLILEISGNEQKWPIN